MKTLLKLSMIMFLLCIAGMATAQDVILKKDNSTILSKVLEINSNEIKYKKWSNQEGPTYSISISEVINIQYQNGNVDKFSNNENVQTQTNTNSQAVAPLQNKGYMDHKVENLTINGRVLPDEEVRSLLDTQTYQQYLEIKRKAKNQYGIGIALTAIGAVSIGTSGILYRVWSGQDNHYNGKLGKTSLALLITGIVTFTPGLVLSLTAGSKLNPIAEEYNKKHGTSYSLNISPSLMQCEIPQSQGNCGMGLTLSLNF